MTQMLMATGEVKLCFETFGAPSDPTLLLIAGSGQSMDWWEVGFCEALATGGRRVIRYDHRDTGRSTTFPVGAPPYQSQELTADPVRLLDSLDIDRVHLVGMSMGGGIAQDLAARYPDRVRTVTLCSTSPAGHRTDDRDLPSVAPRLAEAFGHPPAQPDWTDPSAVIDYRIDIERPYAGSIGFDEERIRRLATLEVGRSRDMAACLTNHDVVISRPGPVPDFRMADITAPTLVLHGTDDPLFPYPHGEALVREIPDARLVPLEGMGHQMPPPRLWEVAAGAIIQHTAHA